MVNKLLRSVRNMRAITAIQYGLIAALIVVPITAAMHGAGTQLKKTLSNAVSNLDAS